MTTPVVRVFRSADTGAPVLSGTAGAVVTVFDAFLVNGYNGQSVSSITRTGSTATVTFAAAHGYATDGLTIVRIAGATQPEYNGDFQISNVTATTFDITVTGTPATPATGTITCVVAPADWTKAYSGTNKAAYRAPSGNRLFLRVQDDNPNADSNTSANTRGYETMTGIDTGTGLFPTLGQLAKGIVINKSSTSDATARPWLAFSDGYSFHFFYAYNASYPTLYSSFYFGDPVSEMSSDPFGVLIFGQRTLGGVPWTDLDHNMISGNSSSIAAQPGHYFCRLFSQVGGAVGAGKLGNVAAGGINIGQGILTYPSPANNSLYVGPLYVSDTSCIRAQIKSIWQPFHTRPLGHGNYISAAQSPIGRRLFAVSITGSGSTLGECHIDIDGPWR